MAINYGSLQATLTPRGVVSGKVQNATRAFVKDYDLLENKPKVNGVELSGDKSLDDLGIEIPEIVANPGDTTENLTSIGIDGVSYNIQGSGGSAVTSVNGKTGDVNLDAEDVGALPDDTPIPSELADLSEDSTHRTVTDTEKQTWDNKSDFSGSYNDLEDKPDIPDELSDLTDDSTHRLVTDTEKTTWNAKSDFSGSYNDLTDKPTLGTAAAKDYATSVIEGSNDLVTGDAVHEAIDNAVSSSYHHAGTKTCAELVSGLLIKANEGNVYNITDSGVTTADFIEGAGKPIEQGANVGVAKIAENTYKFDLLSGVVDTSNFIEKSSTSGLVKNDGSIDTNSYATTSQIPDISGKADKSEMSISTSGDQTTIQLKSGTSATVINQHQDISGKVDKVTGKGLSTNDYDNTAKGIVDSVTSNLANKVDKVTGKGLSTNDYDNTAKSIVDGVTSALAGKANISEMSVTDGTGADADKITIQLKSGTSATVLKTHQDISGKADKVTGATNGNLAGLDANGNLTDSGVAKTDIDDMQDELSTDSATIEGNPINFSTKSAQNAVSTIIDLEPIQDLHGYSKPWVGGAGKNLLHINDTTYGIQNDVTLTTVKDSDGNVIGINLNGNATGNCAFTIYGKGAGDSFSTIAGKTLKLYGGSNSSENIYMQAASTNGLWGRAKSGSGSDAFTVESTEPSNWNAQVIVKSGTNCNNVKIYPMLCLSTESSVYEPYTNICPISGRSEIGILGCGKNLIDPNNMWHYTRDSNTGEIITPPSSNASSNEELIKVKPNTSYLIKHENTSTLSRLFYYDKFKNFIRSETSSTVFTTPINCEYLAFQNGSASGDLDKWFLIETTTDASYSPYTESNDLTISLGQTVYGGTLDLKNGVLVVDKGYAEFDGSNDENWGIGGSTYKYIRNDDIVAKIYSHSVVADIITNRLEAVTFNNMYNNSGVNGVAINDSGKIFIRVDGYDDLTNYKTWLSNNPIQCVYPLANPITIQLAPHQISLLEGVNNISTDGDRITLTYRDGSVATLGDVSIAKALDAQISNPTNGQVLKYDSTDGKWKNGNESGGSAMEVYSTTEQECGVWLDGKPVYKIELVLQNVTKGLSKNIEHSISNIDKIVHYDYLFSDTGLTQAFGDPGDDSNTNWWHTVYRIDRTKVYYSLGTSWNGTWDIYINMRYTKTTDPTPN